MCKCCALFVFCKLIILFATFLLTHLEYSKDIYQALTSLLVLSSFPLFFFCFCIQAVGYPDQLKHLFSCSLRANSIKCILQLDTSLFFKIPHPHPPNPPTFLSRLCARYFRPNTSLLAATVLLQQNSSGKSSCVAIQFRLF